MAKSLVIVESPAKAKTIEKFLGKGYKVLASYGHVRALPSRKGSVDVGRDFEPRYEILAKSKVYLDHIRKESLTSSELILATDPDREGEAIAWHLLEALGLTESDAKLAVRRVTFHEITQNAIRKAMAEPRGIAQSLVDAQQARSILDYLVGFNLSPFLWKKIRYGLSAGRVQSVALRLMCEREKEIQAFQTKEYWTIDALLENVGGGEFKARLVAIGDKKLDKFDIGTQEAARQLESRIKGSDFRIAAVTAKEKKRNPAPPFTTSTLQQEASRKLGFSAGKTMSTAQKLYEGIDIGGGAVGLITYMRTDSVILSTEALAEARDVIGQRFGADYTLAVPREFKSKAKNAQEAHEAIRPTSFANLPEKVKSHLSPDQFRLYDLIWRRAIASQMAAAVLDTTTVDIEAQKTSDEPEAPLNESGERFLFRANGQVIRFPGFMKLYIEGIDENGQEGDKEGTLPPVKQGETVTCQSLLPEQHFTQPPPRFTEAALVKTLEENGIGRPSTYAPIMNTLVTRKYARLEKRTFFPEDLGMVVSDLLSAHFTRYVDYEFTAQMEEALDAISRGEKKWRPMLREFWEPFIALLKQKEVEVSKQEITTETTDRLCPKCGQKLVIKLGRSGKFLACSGFPECRFTESLAVEEEKEQVYSEEKCEKCGAPMLIKSGRYGKFLACSAYPKCKNIQPLFKPKGLGIPCPACHEGELQEKKSRYGKIFYSCNRYPSCKFALWDLPVNEACPKCSYPIVVEKTTKRDGRYRKCAREGCDWRHQLEAPEKPVKKAESKTSTAKKGKTAKAVKAPKTSSKK
ncbi:MAG: type I DNA topoisomerase [Deltaproteobacteria bacterium]|nr:type I DNA topoisomerase [Deltaproteobacteria bacterium]